MNETDRLDADKIFVLGGRARLIGRQGEIHQQVGSTMDIARGVGESQTADGHVVLAEHQTAGRGRQGIWQSGPGLDLLMSVVLRLALPAGERKLIGMMGAVAAAEAVGRFGPPARIKWPNDVVIACKVNGLRLRKLGGVLVEQSPRGGAAPAHVLGIGLNVNESPEQLPPGVSPLATSVRIEREGVPVNRNALCRCLLERLDYWYQRLQMRRPEAILARWRSMSCLLGERVRAVVGEQALEGTVSGILASGELILTDSGGSRSYLSEGTATITFEGDSPRAGADNL